MPDAYCNCMSRNRFNLITKYMYLNYAAAEHFDTNGNLIDLYHKLILAQCAQLGSTILISQLSTDKFFFVQMIL